MIGRITSTFSDIHGWYYHGKNTVSSNIHLMKRTFTSAYYYIGTATSPCNTQRSAFLHCEPGHGHDHASMSSDIGSHHRATSGGRLAPHPASSRPRHRITY